MKVSGNFFPTNFHAVRWFIVIHTNSPRCQVQLPTLFLFNGVVKCLKIYHGWLILMKPGEEAPSHGWLHQSFCVRLSMPKPLLIDLDVRSGMSWLPPPPLLDILAWRETPQAHSPSGPLYKWPVSVHVPHVPQFFAVVACSRLLRQPVSPSYQEKWMKSHQHTRNSPFWLHSKWSQLSSFSTAVSLLFIQLFVFWCMFLILTSCLVQGCGLSTLKGAWK